MVSATKGAPRAGGAPQEPSVQAMADRVEGLLASFDAVSTPRQARDQAEALVRTIVGLYGAGLERVLTILHENFGPSSDALFEKLCEDRFVESLLVLHDLHPLSLEERVQRALDSVRPYLKSHEGGIEIVRVADGVAYLRLEGSCDGCPSSTATVKLAVERAILERVPEIVEVRADGVATHANGAPPSSTLRLESDWVELAGIPRLTTLGLAALDIDATPVVLLQLDDTIYAYRNRCPDCSARFEETASPERALVCSACGAGFDVVRAGRARDGGRSFAEPFPLVREGGHIRVAIPLGA